MITIRAILAAVLLATPAIATAADRSSADLRAPEEYGVVLKRDARTKLFLVPVRMGDVNTTMIVDTGASITMLTPNDAAALGRDLTIMSDAYVAGITGAARVPFSRTPPMSVAGIRIGRRDVVTVGGSIGLSLLGQSELKALGRITIEGDVMTIQPKG